MENNIAFIDWQNLHLWTIRENWQIDFKRFRIYIKDKFKVNEVYIFLWFVNNEYQKIYKKMQKAWFLLEFREHNINMLWIKKWNVDVDIVYEIMYRLLEKDNFDKIILVTGDGDYIKLVKYLIKKNRLKKILFPNNKYSSLYKSIKDKYWMNLWQDRVKKFIKYRKK